MSSITRSTQSTRPDSIGSTETPGSATFTDQDDTSVRTVEKDPKAQEILRTYKELQRRVNRPMEDFDQQSATLAPNYQQGGNETKPGS
jgi:hypothetical protein